MTQMAHIYIQVSVVMHSFDFKQRINSSILGKPYPRTRGTDIILAIYDYKTFKIVKQKFVNEL